MNKLLKYITIGCVLLILGLILIIVVDEFFESLSEKASSNKTKEQLEDIGIGAIFGIKVLTFPDVVDIALPIVILIAILVVVCKVLYDKEQSGLF